jgi:large subunit ribosomal protein L30
MATRKAEKRQEAIDDLVRRMNAGEGTSDRTYRVVLAGSAIGTTHRQRATLKCLGLGRRGTAALVKDSPQTRGRIRAVAHLVRVEEAS